MTAGRRRWGRVAAIVLVLLIGAVLTVPRVSRTLLYVRHANHDRQVGILEQRWSWLPGDDIRFPDQVCENCFWAERPTEFDAWVADLREESPERAEAVEAWRENLRHEFCLGKTSRLLGLRAAGPIRYRLLGGTEWPVDFTDYDCLCPVCRAGR